MDRKPLLPSFLFPRLQYIFKNKNITLDPFYKIIFYAYELIYLGQI